MIIVEDIRFFVCGPVHRVEDFPFRTLLVVEVFNRSVGADY